MGLRLRRAQRRALGRRSPGSSSPSPEGARRGAQEGRSVLCAALAGALVVLAVLVAAVAGFAAGAAWGAASVLELEASPPPLGNPTLAQRSLRWASCAKVLVLEEAGLSAVAAWLAGVLRVGGGGGDQTAVESPPPQQPGSGDPGPGLVLPAAAAALGGSATSAVLAWLGPRRGRRPDQERRLLDSPEQRVRRLEARSPAGFSAGLSPLRDALLASLLRRRE